MKSTLERELDVPEIFAQQAIGTLRGTGMCFRKLRLPGSVVYVATSLGDEEHKSQLHHWYLCVSRVQFRARAASVVSAQGAGSQISVNGVGGPTVCVVFQACAFDLIELTGAGCFRTDPSILSTGRFGCSNDPS